MSDISSIAATERTVEIVHPATQETIGLTLTLRHESSKEVRAVEKKWLAMGLKGRKLSPDMLEARNLEVLIAHVSGWTWGNDVNGEPCTFEGGVPEFTELNVRKVFKALPWVKKQVDTESGVDQDFFKG